MAESDDALIQECTNCGVLIDISDAEPFALMHCPTCGAAMRVRRTFDHFELQELMGAGGMGSVYRALDTNLNREVAFKLLHAERSADPEFVAQFEKEAAITASINHPHVVKVFTTGCDHGLVYIAMELVDQGSLEDLMNREGRVPEIQVLNVGIQIAQGLNAALERGLIHRDIKPGNILFANANSAKIVDFGLAVLMEHAGTVAGEVWATPAYVPPETLEGLPEDFRGDMYSLGASLFHALTGQSTHVVETNAMSELLEIKSKPVSVHAVAPEVSGPTAFVLDRMLSHSPDERYQSYAELIEHLEFARTELLEAMRQESDKTVASQRPRDFQEKSNWLTMAVVAAVVIAGVGAYKFRGLILHQPSAAEVEEKQRAAAGPSYPEARKLLAAGEAKKAAEMFAALEAQPGVPQPQLNWITLHAGLAQMHAGDLAAARQRFAKIEERGAFSTDPSEQILVNFFLDTAHTAAQDEAVPVARGQAIDRTNYETLALLIFAVKDWTLEKFDEADALFRQFILATPEERHAWVSEYKPIAKERVAQLSAWRSAGDAMKNATTLGAKKQALEVVRNAKVQLPAEGKLRARVETMEQEFSAAIAAEEAQQQQRLAAQDAADAKAIAEVKTKLGPLAAQYRFAEAHAAALATKVIGEKARVERDAMVKKTDWLAKFKGTLIVDISTIGYIAPLSKKNGIQLPGALRRANEVQVETVTQFGSLPVPWTELSADSIIRVAQSFLRANFPPDRIADRQWYLGVFALFNGREKDGRDLLFAASQLKPEYSPHLALFAETTDAK